MVTPTYITDFHRSFRPMWLDEGHADFADDADLDLFGLGFRRFREIWLMTCRILALFLVVSKKKRIFAAEVLNIEGIDYEKYE